MKRIGLFALRELHLPCLLPVFKALRKFHHLEVGVLTSKICEDSAQVPFEGLRQSTIKSLSQAGAPFWGTNPDGKPFDCVVTADFCAEWIEGWGPSVCVGHGTISKNIYFTANQTARRESYHDALCVPGPWFASSFGHFVKTRIVPTGFPKMDEYACTSAKIAEIKRDLSFPTNRINVLVAPTFNPEFSALPVVEEALKQIDTSRFHVHIKLHGATEPSTANRFRQLCANSESLTLSENPSVAPLLLAADIVITDVSSILLEAIAADKKVIAVNNPRRFGFSLYEPDCVEFRFRDAAYEVWDPDALLDTLKLLSNDDPKRQLRQETALRLFGNLDGRNAERAADVIMSIVDGKDTRPCPFSFITVQPAKDCPHAIANILWNLATRRWRKIPVAVADQSTKATLEHLNRAADLDLTLIDLSAAKRIGETIILTGKHHFPKDWDYTIAVSSDFMEGRDSRILAPVLLGSPNPFQSLEFIRPDLKGAVDSAQSSLAAAQELQRRMKYRLFHESHSVPLALADGCLIPAKALSPETLSSIRTQGELPQSIFDPTLGHPSPRVLPALIGISGAWNALSKLTDTADSASRLLHVVDKSAKPESAPSSLSEGPRTEYLVSAIISTYRSEKFIRGRLQDLLSQTIASRIEIIVIDSGSPENEASIVREFESQFPNIRYVRTPERETIYSAWNRGVQLAKGKYLTNANTDDRLRADALETLVRALESDPKAGVAYGRQYITTVPNQTFTNATPIGTHDWPQVTLENILVNCNTGSQPLWRRSLHDTFGLFDSSLEIAGDYEFWIRCCLGGVHFILIPERIGLYYKSLTGANKEFQNRFRTYNETYTVQRRNLLKVLSSLSSQELEANLGRARITITDQLDGLRKTSQIEPEAKLRLEHTFWETAVSLEILGRAEASRNFARSFFDIINDSYKLAFHLREISNRPPPALVPRAGALVSIIIPCHNCEKTLPQTLQSVLNQSYQRLEVFLIDDGSSDRTLQLIKEFAATHTKWSPTVIQQANRGPAAARNAAAKTATGEFLLHLDSDDEIAWDFIEQCLKMFEVDPSLDVVFTEAVFFGSKNKIWALSDVSIPALYCHNQLTVTSMVRASSFHRVGGFDEQLMGYEDWDLWISLARSGARFKHLREPLFLYRHTAKSRNYQANLSDSAIKQAIIAKHTDIYRELKQHELSILNISQQIPPTLLLNDAKAASPNRIKSQPSLASRGSAPSENGSQIWDYRSPSNACQPPRKILFVCHDFPPYKYAGAQLYTFELAKELIALGDDVWVFHPVDISKTSSGAEVYSIEKTDFQGVGIFRIVIDEKGGSGRSDPFLSKPVEERFRELLIRENFDLVHFHLLFRLSATLPMVTKSLSIPSVATLHDYWLLCSMGHMIDTQLRECSGPETPTKCADCSSGFHGTPSPKVVSYFEARKAVALDAYKCIDHVISPSHFLADIHARFGFPRPSILPLGWLPVKAKPSATSRKTITFGYCGQIIVRKGVDILLKALNALPKHLEWKLQIHGQVYEPHYMSEVLAPLSTDPRIEYLGGYTTEDLPDIYSSIDVSIMPSRRENYPLTVLESLSAGVPVIASDVGGVREMLNDGEEGLIFRNADVHHLTSILREIIENPSTIKAMKLAIRPIKIIQEDARELSGIYTFLNE